MSSTVLIILNRKICTWRPAIPLNAIGFTGNPCNNKIVNFITHNTTTSSTPPRPRRRSPRAPHSCRQEYALLYPRAAGLPTVYSVTCGFRPENSAPPIAVVDSSLLDSDAARAGTQPGFPASFPYERRSEGPEALALRSARLLLANTMHRASVFAALALAAVALLATTARAAPAPPSRRLGEFGEPAEATLPGPVVRARKKKKKKRKGSKKRKRSKKKKRSKKRSKRSRKRKSKKKKKKRPKKKRATTRGGCGRARLQLRAFSARIAGGGSNPAGASYHVALFSGVRLCTGALVAPGWVLSAAHCALLPGDKLRIGGPSATSGAARSVRTIVRHPKFLRDSTKVANDVMLVALDTPVSAASVRINSARGSPAPGMLVRASGYGRQATKGARGPLRFADLDVVGARECAGKFARNGLNLLAKGVTDGVHLCANHDACDSGPCFGDSGGPLVASDGDGRPVLVGVASYGTAECGSRHTPDVYARISTYRAWIEKVTRGEAKFVTLE